MSLFQYTATVEAWVEANTPEDAKDKGMSVEDEANILAMLEATG